MTRKPRTAPTPWLLAGAILLAAVSAYAVDVVVRPAIGDALSVRSQADSELFRVAESGEIILPQPPPMQSGEQLCRATFSGELVRCGGYEVREEQIENITMQPGDSQEFSLNCPSDTRVLGGGYWVTAVPPENFLVVRNQPNSIGTGWVYRVKNISAAPDQFFMAMTVTCGNV